MGACLSSLGGGEMLIDAPDGDAKAFHERYIEEDVLGEGEFGQVKRVFETSNPNVPLACKTLKKGMVFKDNQLYPALPPEMLRGEIEILRALRGKDTYCLQLHSIYETPKAILLVTELCAGGEMMEYVAKKDNDLRTEDVSRISFQLLSAIDFCAKKTIIHRDLKPANIMFESADPKSSLRVIDFGASVKNDPNDKESLRHTTFAGTAFYNSPEMFAKKYTQKTDIFSVGVTLYVLVAGYPADELQKAFNVLRCSSKGPKRNLKALPNMPQNMPESYYDMLEELLTYQPKYRKTAGEMMTHPFVTFHQDLAKEEAEEAQAGPEKRPSMFRRQSCVLTGTAQRHNAMLGYKKFERSLTALLATMLSQPELQRLVDMLTKTQNELVEGIEDETEATTGSDSETLGRSTGLGQLGTIPLDRLIKLVEDYIQNQGV
jgi:serine/threonine protein kinase